MLQEIHTSKNAERTEFYDFRQPWASRVCRYVRKSSQVSRPLRACILRL